MRRLGHVEYEGHGSLLSSLFVIHVMETFKRNQRIVHDKMTWDKGTLLIQNNVQ